MATAPATDAAAERLVRYTLRRRGIRCGPGRHLGAIVPRSARGRDALYELLKRYSFRLFLRDLIRLHWGAQPGGRFEHVPAATLLNLGSLDAPAMLSGLLKNPAPCFDRLSMSGAPPRFQ